MFFFVIVIRIKLKKNYAINEILNLHVDAQPNPQGLSSSSPLGCPPLLLQRWGSGGVGEGEQQDERPQEQG